MKPSNCDLIPALSCDDDTPIVEVARILRKHKQRRIIVVNDDLYPIGILSVTDISNKVVAEGKDPNTVTAKEIKEDLAIVADCNQDLIKLGEEMQEKSIYMAPIVKEGKLCGIINYGEIIKRAQNVIRSCN